MAKALVLSGGSQKGIFELGVVEKLLSGETQQYKNLYNDLKIFCGVSAGAINTSLVSQKDKVSDLHKYWFDQIEGKISAFKRKCFFQKFWLGLFDHEGLRKLLKEKLKNFSAEDKYVYFGAVCLQDGKYYALPMNNNSFFDNREDLVLASTSIPVIFDPVVTKNPSIRQTEDEVIPATVTIHFIEESKNNKLDWVDGGVRSITPLGSVFDIAKAKKIDLDEIIIVISSPFGIKDTPDKRYDNMLDVALRSQDIITDQIYLQDIYSCLRTNYLIDLLSLIDENNIADSKLMALKQKYGTKRKIKLTLFHPDKSLWKNFKEESSDPFIKKLDDNIIEAYPDGLCKDEKIFKAIYSYGRYIANYPISDGNLDKLIEDEKKLYNKVV